MRAFFPMLAALSSAVPVSVGATLPPPPPPHTPQRAGCALSALVSAIDGKDRAFFAKGPKIVSERLGEVAPEELDEFFTEFAGGGGRRAQPLRLNDWGLLEVSGTAPLYVMTLQRGSGRDGHWSTWLVQFGSDEIVRIRRADELWRFADHRHRFDTDDCSKSGLHG